MAAQPIGPMLTPQQQFILNEFNGQTYEPNKMDVQHTPIYDTVAFAAAATMTTSASQYFVVTATKSINQTNVQTSKKLDAPEAFTVKSFKLWWRQDVLLADLYSIVANCVLEFIIGNKVYQRGPLWLYAPGGGHFPFFTTTATAIINNGQPGRHAMHVLAINVVIDNQASFFGQLNFPTSFVLAAAGAGGVGFTSQLLLDGLYARGVQ